MHILCAICEKVIIRKISIHDYSVDKRTRYKWLVLSSACSLHLIVQRKRKATPSHFCRSYISSTQRTTIAFNIAGRQIALKRHFYARCIVVPKIGR